MRWLRCLTGALLCTLLASPLAWGQTPAPQRASITVVLDDNYPPYIFRDATGSLQGILVDSWALWQARTGVTVDLQAMDWAKAQERMQAGQADVIDTIFINEPRQRLYDFTAPYTRIDVPIFFHHSISGIVNADSLKAFTVGVKDGDACIDVLRERGVDNMKAYPGYTALITAAAAGDVRVFCVDQPPAIYLLHQLGVEAEFRRSVPLYSGAFHRAVHKGDAATLKLVERGFAQISAAERQRIDDKWYGTPLGSPGLLAYARHGAVAMLAVLVMALLLVAWNRSLHRRVALKTTELSLSVQALEQARRAAESTLSHLNATLEAIPDLLFEVDIEGRYFDCRAARADLLLMPADQLLGHTVREVMPADAADTTIQALHQAAADGRSSGAVLCLPLPGGERWFELSVSRMRSGAVDGDRFIVLSRDITGRKQSEIALRQSEQRFRQFFEAGLVGMAIALPDKRWSQCNQRLAEMLGYSPQELLGLRWAELTVPEDLPENEVHFNRVLAGETEGYTMDKRFVRKDGSVMDAAIAVRCERNEQGKVERFFTVVEDITQRKQAERELQHHRDRLEQLVDERSHELVLARDAAQAASRAKSEFLSRMSHELRTPMNAILGFSQLLELDDALSPGSRRFVKELLGAGRHLLELINDVLDLAHVESGRLTLALEAVPLAAIGAEVLTLMQPLADQRRVALHADVDRSLVVHADRMRLKQVLVNLVSNAVKYNAAGGSVHIEVQALDAQQLRLAVRDTGPGIAAERLSQVFEPFNRLGAEYGPVEGTGIGLSICQRLVDLMGGRIGVASTPGQGSTFWIELPRGPQAAVAGAPATQPGAPAAAPALLGSVLYVEDNPANLRLIEQFIERHAGLRLFSASSARQGLELARTRCPDLILLDISLPDMDGYELLAALRADPRTRDIPAAAVTAHAMPSDARRALQAGFAEHLTKPIDLAAFDRLLHRHLGTPAAEG